MYMFAFYSCGLRVSDIITLEWKHINLDKKVISKNFYKTKKNSIDIPLVEPAIDILEKWKGRNNRFVFDLLPDDFNLNDQKKLMQLRLAKNRVFQESLKTIGNKIGVNFNLTFHSARHSFAVYAIKVSIRLRTTCIIDSKLKATCSSWPKLGQVDSTWFVLPTCLAGVHGELHGCSRSRVSGAGHPPSIHVD